jgi:hypothetical protein
MFDWHFKNAVLMTPPKGRVKKQEVYISSQEIFEFYLAQCNSVLKCEADSSFHL